MISFIRRLYLSLLVVLMGFGGLLTGWMLVTFRVESPPLGWLETLAMAWGPLLVATGCGGWVRWLFSGNDSGFKQSIREAAEWLNS